MKHFGIPDAGIRRIAEAAGAPMLTEEIEKHFVDRTNRHIKLVQKYCKLIASEWSGLEELIERGEKHDASKFGSDELVPYIWLTWRYKCKDDGVECNLPDGMEDDIDKATEHHILSNAHHPEYHQSETEGLLNKEDRDAPPDEMVDATGMSDLDIAECAADWCAMSEERGNTPREWAEKNVNVRWKFTPEQESLIFDLIDSVWNE